MFKSITNCRTCFKVSFALILHSLTLCWLNATIVNYVAHSGKKELHFSKRDKNFATDDNSPKKGGKIGLKRDPRLHACKIQQAYSPGAFPLRNRGYSLSVFVFRLTNVHSGEISSLG